MWWGREAVWAVKREREGQIFMVFFQVKKED